MVFYKNGVQLEGFPIFYYGSHDAVSLIADILDGYFPRQLEKSHPDGVLLEVIDKLDDVYGDKQTNQKPEVANLWNGKGREIQPLSKDEFLNKLPEKVIREGKIVEIRKGVESHLNKILGNPVNSAVKTETKLKGVVKNESGDWVVQNEYILDERYKGSIEISVLKVRLDFINESIILHTKKDTKLKDLLSQLVRCLTDKDKTKRYRLVNGFPRTEFDPESSETLEEKGLYPRSAIYMQSY